MFGRLGALAGLLTSLFFLGKIGVASSLQTLATIGLVGAFIFGWAEWRHWLSVRSI